MRERDLSRESENREQEEVQWRRKYLFINIFPKSQFLLTTFGVKSIMESGMGPGQSCVFEGKRSPVGGRPKIKEIREIKRTN